MSAPQQELIAGQTLPAASFITLDGESFSADKLRGQKTVVYFYPAAFTPGCTTEACDFRDNLGALSAAGYAVYAVSGDDPATLRRFAEEYSLAYTLLSDPDSAAAKAWGAWGEKTINGKTLTGVLRSTFICDAEGTLEHALYRVDPVGHVRHLRELLGV